MKRLTVDLEQLDKQIKQYSALSPIDYDEGIFELLCTIYEEVELNKEVTFYNNK